MQYFLCKALSTLHEVLTTLVTLLSNYSRKQIFLRVTALEVSCLYWICLRGVKLDKATSRYFFFTLKFYHLPLQVSRRRLTSGQMHVFPWDWLFRRHCSESWQGLETQFTKNIHKTWCIISGLMKVWEISFPGRFL